MRNVLVTGGSRGLGLAISCRLVASGFRVIAIARRPTDALAAAQDAAVGEGGMLCFRPFDLSDTAALADLVKQVRAAHGPIYGLVNNAGLGTAGVLANMKDADVQDLVGVNVVASILLTKYAIRSMMAQRGGRIVNISSVVACTGYSGLSVYSATKAALGGFTRSLAREVGSLGITVNTVAPGFVDTEMTHSLNPADRAKIMRRSALQRLPRAADVASMVNYLFSAEASNITGTTLTVDAGNTA